jgi:glycosyltransferase 2 family protein
LSDSSRRERFRWAQAVLALLGVAVLVFLVRRAGEAAIRSALDEVRPIYLVLDVVIVALIFVGFALRWRYLLRGLGLDVGLGSVLGARVAGLAVGTLTPGAKLGGEPLRAYLLGRRGVPLGPAIATVVVDRGIELLANVVFAVVYCALFAMRDVGAAGRVFAVVAAAGAGLTFGVRIVLKRLETGRSLVPARFRSVLERLGAGEATLADIDRALHELVFRHRRRVLVGLGWALVLNAVIFLDYLTLFAAFGPLPSLPDLAGSMLGVGFAHALPVPASIGALEGAQAAVFELAGESHRAIVAAAAVRLRDILWTLPGLIYLAVLALRRRLA